MKNHVRILFAILALSTINHQLSTALAQGTAFTYQGQLQNNGAPASGTYNLQFSLYTNSTGGAAIAGPVTNSAVGVTNGLFTVVIDFGSNVWNGQTNWLQIGVATNGSNSFTALAPRQQLTPVPYAISAESLNGTVGSAGLSGTYGNQVTLNNPANQFNGSYAGNGGGLTNVNAATVGGLAATNFWQTTGNTGTTAGVNFVGTTDNQPLELRANGQRILRLLPDTSANNAPDIIGGSPTNTMTSGLVGVTISGGAVNSIGPASLFSSNNPYGDLSAYPAIGASFSTISGGFLNEIQTNATFSTVAGGALNTIQAGAIQSSIGGGFSNTVLSSGSWSTVAGGTHHTIGSVNGFIGGGWNNTIQSDANYSAIGGGLFNQINGDAFEFGTSVIAGGYFGIINSNSWNSFIGGGGGNTIGTNSDHSVIVGGNSNTLAAAEYGTIGGGVQNTVGAYSATVPGGNLNFAGGVASFAAGQHAQATNNGAFVWSDDSTTNPFSSTISNQFNVRATGGMRLVTGGTGMTLDAQPVVPSGNYVYAYASGVQFVATPGAFQNAIFTTDAQLNGWTHSPDSTMYVCNQTGLYLIQYTAEAMIADAMSMRGALNFIEIPGSQAFESNVNLGTTTVITKSFLASVSSGSILTIQFEGNSTSDELDGGGAGTVLPGISLTITRIQ